MQREGVESSNKGIAYPEETRHAFSALWYSNRTGVVVPGGTWGSVPRVRSHAQDLEYSVYRSRLWIDAIRSEALGSVDVSLSSVRLSMLVMLRYRSAEWECGMSQSAKCPLPIVCLLRYGSCLVRLIGGIPWYGPESPVQHRISTMVFMWEVVCGCRATTAKDGMSLNSLVIYMVLES